MSLNQRIFHADDWGFSPAINAGILALAERGVLKSVACIANARYLDAQIELLLSYVGQGVEVYLHLNLTSGAPLIDRMAAASFIDPRTGLFYPHRTLIRKCLLKRVDAPGIASELRAQLQKLRELRLPVSGINGHHHVHLLPVIATAMQEVLADPKGHQGAEKIQVMVDRDHLPSFTQTLLYKRLLYRPSARYRLEPCYYLRPSDLRSRREFEHKKRRALGSPLLVHPALENDFKISAMTDPLQEDRVRELDTIMKYIDA
jgi:hypothetical protein